MENSKLMKSAVKFNQKSKIRSGKGNFDHESYQIKLNVIEKINNWIFLIVIQEHDMENSKLMKSAVKFNRKSETSSKKGKFPSRIWSIHQWNDGQVKPIEIDGRPSPKLFRWNSLKFSIEFPALKTKYNLKIQNKKKIRGQP